MRNILLQLGSTFSGYDFFSDQYLCDPQTASRRFNNALKEAREYYCKQKQIITAPGLIHESWSQNIAALESYFAKQMSEDFILNRVINGTMVFTDRKAHTLELKNLSKAFDKKTIEEIISKGLNAGFLAGKAHRATLINSANHMHHLMRFEQITGRKIDSIESVVEFGGGYGNMARIAQNMGSCKKYSVIDLLLFSCIQYVFLSTVAGLDQVAFRDEANKENAKFFLHPLLSTKTSYNLQGNLFLSTWALSESTSAIYEWVTSNDWFGATNLLLAYNIRWQPWRENELEESLAKNGWRITKEVFPFLPESLYLFATR
ncbi:MAG: Uncharacterized protein FD134_326 [Gallionellaceae bacterium]|nr:MAG: Uncharacterized protein FD134_326 [Gallionellaceae bacterium]